MAGSSAEQGEVCGMTVGLWGQHGPSRQYQAGAVWVAWSKEAVPKPVLWRQQWNQWEMPSEAEVGGSITQGLSVQVGSVGTAMD